MSSGAERTWALPTAASSRARRVARMSAMNDDNSRNRLSPVPARVRPVRVPENAMSTPPDAPPPPPFPFSPKDAMEFMQRMWNPLGVPLPGFALPGTVAATPQAAPGAGGVPFPNPAAMFATLDPAELE